MRRPPARRPAADDSAVASASGPAKPSASGTTIDAETRYKQSREAFTVQLGALEARGAGVRGGTDYASAKSRAAEAVGAHDAGSLSLAQKRIDNA